MEIWKAIPGYEGLYEMTADGRVRSLNYYGKKDKIHEMKQVLNSDYLVVGLYKEGKRKYFGIHVLLAMTFLGHIPDGHTLVVDHINNIQLDNRIENLQIITHRENTSKDTKRNLPTGVYTNRNKFVSKIKIQGKQKCLGSFSTPEQASAAYQKALLTVNGGRPV